MGRFRCFSSAGDWDFVGLGGCGGMGWDGMAILRVGEVGWVVEWWVNRWIGASYNPLKRMSCWDMG